MSRRVSVITATYNQGRYLADAIDSVLSQTGVDVELIVVDDASTDDTREILARYGDRIRVIAITENCGGPARPRNLGFKAATGDYIAILDGDDVMYPGRLSEQVAFFEAHEDVSFLCANFRNFDENSAENATDELAGHPDFLKLPRAKLGERWYRLPVQGVYETLIGDNFIGVATVMFRRSILETVGLMDESLSRSEDIEYWYRIARVCTFGYIDAILAGRRLHGTNISASPAALEAKLEIYRRQEPVPMSPAARRMLRRMMAKIHYSLGFIDRQQGRRFSAAKRYLNSLSCDFNRGRALISLAATLMPTPCGHDSTVWGALSERSTRLIAVSLASLVAAAAIIRSFRIGSRGLWGDEMDLWLGSLCGWRSGQAAPLQFIVYGSWLRLTNAITSELAVHVPSVVIGSLAVVPMYFLGKQLFDRRTGLLAALFTVLSPMAIYYSQEARPYAMFFFFVACTLFFFVRARADGRFRWTVAFIISAALSFLTHMLTGFVLAGIVIWAFVEDMWDRSPWRFLPVIIASAISTLGAWWMFYRYKPVASTVASHYGASPLIFLRVLLFTLGPDIAGSTHWTPFSTVGAVLIFIFVVLGVWRIKKERSGLLFALLPITAAVCLGMLFMTMGGKEAWRWERYTTAVLPMYLVLLSGGCLSLPGHWRKLTVAGVISILVVGDFIWADRETFDRMAAQRAVSSQLSARENELNGFVMLSPAQLISPPLSVYTFTLLRRDHLPTYMIMETGLFSIPAAPIPPVGTGWVSVEMKELPPGRYLVFDWAPWSGPIQGKLSAQGLGSAQLIFKPKYGEGGEIYVVPSSTTVLAIRR